MAIETKTGELLKELFKCENEFAGHFTVSDGKIVFHDFIEGSVDEKGRKMSKPPKKSTIWHTHPLSSKGYPSVEDILGVVKSHRDKDCRYSLIATSWGIWILQSKYKTKLTDPLIPKVIRNILATLYSNTGRGRKYSSIPVEYMIRDLQSLFKNLGFKIDLFTWEDVENGVNLL